jgi:Pin2-interacting protein X1
VRNALIMSSTGAKWSKDASNFGKQLMKKSGWEEGKGLGKNEDGIVENVKTTRKDNTLGIGYDGQVQQTWSTQSVGFADILSRINTKMTTVDDSDDDGETEESSSPPTVSPVARGPTGGKHSAAYAKRRNLKTEGLRSDEGKAEILGASSSTHKRARDSDENPFENDKSTLVSPLLVRLLDRCPAHEPRPSMDAQSTVEITKPDPRPPRPADTPFYS